MNYAEAMTAVNDGKKVRRKGQWNDMFVLHNQGHHNLQFMCLIWDGELKPQSVFKPSIEDINATDWEEVQ